MKKRVLALLLAGAAVASLAACGSSDSGASGSGSAAGGDGEVVELVMGNVTSSSAKDAVTEILIPKVEEYSNGTLKIVHFPDNQLGNDEQSFAMAQTGECDIAVGSTSSVATTYNDLYVYDVPYLFLNKQEVYDVGFNGETGKAILDGFSEYGLKGLAFWENGFRNITTTDKDIATVADLSGLKIRTMANEIHLEAWKAMGANPTPMAFGELFTGLQQGTVDGQENPLGIITGNKFEEVQSYCTLTEHVYTPYYVVMNQAKWDSLTAEQQEALTKAIEETTQHDGRDEGDKDLPVEVPLVKELLERRAALWCWRMVELEEALPVEQDHREDGAKLDDDREGLDKRRARHSQQVLCDDHMACGRDGKKLGQSLYDGDDDGFYQVHYASVTLVSDDCVAISAPASPPFGRTRMEAMMVI